MHDFKSQLEHIEKRLQEERLRIKTAFHSSNSIYVVTEDGKLWRQRVTFDGEKWWEHIPGPQPSTNEEE